MDQSLPTLSILGAGHLGRTLGRLWQQAGVFQIQDVITRSEQSAQQAVQFIGAGQARSALTSLRPASVWLIATSDPVLRLACDQLVEAGLPLSGSVVFHCSGALGSDLLARARQAGALTASVHPVRSFARPEEVVAGFAGTVCGAEGDAAALALLGDAFGKIGARLVPIDLHGKTLYHAAAVFASNYLVTLMEAALQTWAAAGVPRDEALKMMAPLARNTLNNVLEAGTAAALSGPISRGDWSTVQQHQQALDVADPALGRLYALLAEHTGELAKRREQQNLHRSGTTGQS